MKPLLTICEEKAKSAAHVEHLIVLGCVRVSLLVSTGSADDRLRLSFDKRLDKRDVGINSDGVGGVPTGLDGVESVGDVLNDGGVSLGELA